MWESGGLSCVWCWRRRFSIRDRKRVFLSHLKNCACFSRGSGLGFRGDTSAVFCAWWHAGHADTAQSAQASIKGPLVPPCLDGLYVLREMTFQGFGQICLSYGLRYVVIHSRVEASFAVALHGVRGHGDDGTADA